MTQGIFDPKAPTREDLERRLAELLAEYSTAGGARGHEIDLEIRRVRAQLGRMPRPAAPAAPLPPRREPRSKHDGRLAATGEAKEDETP